MYTMRRVKISVSMFVKGCEEPSSRHAVEEEKKDRADRIECVLLLPQKPAGDRESLLTVNDGVMFEAGG